MSQSARLADYRTALTTPAARGPVIAAAVARFPIAMVGLSLLLYVQRTTGSFAVAGAVSAAGLVGLAVGSVVQGRLMDRLGPSRPIIVAAALFGLVVAATVVAVEARAAEPVLLALAFAEGLTEPMVGSASRAMWSRVLPPGPARHAAYAYEAISMEVFFVLGPAASGLLLTAPWPGTGVVVGAAGMAAGSLVFALTGTVRSWRGSTERDRAAAQGEHRGGGRGLLGALAGAGIRTVALAALGMGAVIGFIEVAVPAAATRAGQPAAGGLLLSLWSVTSVLAGVLYGRRPWPRPLHLRLPALLAAFAALVLLLAAPTTLTGLAVAMLLAGTMIAPQTTTHSAALEQVAPAGTMAEAFGWVITAIMLGLAAGQSLAGQIVERFGPPWALLAAAACGLLVAGAVWLARHTVAAGAGSAGAGRSRSAPGFRRGSRLASRS
ncbi:MFS transporter [Gandjariella thermophila]|uniref:MFS transporter n=1 Tax=Gandjariella thermophila TaxID=1931992 RepID=A0A4D4J6R0_9PSEU|nr:MFS transporter [Gandjariella thermophila]GDY30720.1 MFS transporter [Gandjariella thermophila]